MFPFLCQDNLNEQLLHGDESLAHQTTMKDQQSTHCGPYPSSCNKSYTNMKVLKEGQSIHSQKRPFSLFREENGFRAYKCVSQLALQFSCEVCSKQFKFESDLKNHQYTHIEETPFSCAVYCGAYPSCSNKSYTNMKVLEERQFIHSEKQALSLFREENGFRAYKCISPLAFRFSCEVCSKSFRYRSDLRNHQLTHGEERQFSCAVCNKLFKRLKDVEVHQRMHSEERPFPCDLCNKSFKSHFCRKRHQLSHKSEHQDSVAIMPQPATMLATTN
jgi:KRAB domain-containing zinc finger protein